MKTRIIVIVVIIGCVLSGLWFWYLRNAVLRFDGVYQADRLAPWTRRPFHTYFRFFPDGKLAFISIAEDGLKGAPPKIRKEQSGDLAGAFKIPYSRSGRSISFSAIYPNGLVDYDGKIGVKGIHFVIHSQINGVDGDEDFTFYPFEPAKAP